MNCLYLDEISPSQTFGLKSVLKERISICISITWSHGRFPNTIPPALLLHPAAAWCGRSRENMLNHKHFGRHNCSNLAQYPTNNNSSNIINNSAPETKTTAATTAETAKARQQQQRQQRHQQHACPPPPAPTPPVSPSSARKHVATRALAG